MDANSRISILTRFGSDTSDRLVISNRSSQLGFTSGFGSAEYTDVGVDAVVEIGGDAYTAYGDTVMATRRAEKGITLRIAASPSDPTYTAFGALGHRHPWPINPHSS